MRAGHGQYKKRVHRKSRAQKAGQPHPVLTSTSHPRSKRQVPREARSVIQILRIKLRSSEPIPSTQWRNQGQIRIQNTPPAPSYVVDGIDAAITEIRVPFLSHEVWVPDVPTGGIDRDHVYSLDILVVGAEVSRVVDLILEQDAGVFVADEVGGLIDIGGFEEEVVLETTFLYS